MIRMNILSPEHVQLQAISDGVQELNKTFMDAGAPPAVLINKAGELCSPTWDGELVKLTKDSLAAILRSMVEPGRPKKDAEEDEPIFVPIPGIPRPMVMSYIDAKRWAGLPIVKQVASAPIIRPDFTVRWEPGYDEATACWVTAGLKKNTWLIDAGFDLRRVFSLFPLTDTNMVADCFAAALTPLLSTAIGSPLPAFLVTARKPGSGKSELAKFCSMLGNGGKQFTTWRKTEEMQKLVASFAAEDRRTVIFDNIKYQINSSDLESAITSRKLTYRTMGTHTSKSIPCNTSWFFTSNGASMSQDLLRRSIVVLLDKDANPKGWEKEDEKGHTHGSTLVRFVEKNQDALVTSMCAMIEDWRVAGCPHGAVSFSNFEEWSATVSGILEVAGIDGLFSAREAVLPDAVSTDEADEIAIVNAIADVMGVGEFFSAADLWKKCNNEMEWFGTPAEGSARFLKDWFKSATNGRSYDSEQGGGIGMGRALSAYKDKLYSGCGYKLTFQKTAVGNGYKIEKRLELTWDESFALEEEFEEVVDLSSLGVITGE